MMVLVILGLLPLGLTVAMFATRNFMLGFPSAIFWGVLGGYSYQQSQATWDWQYLLFFASMGMLIFSIFAAYSLRERDLDEPDTDEGKFFDESSRTVSSKSVNETTRKRQRKSEGDRDGLDADDMGEHSRPSRRIRAVRERAERRRTKGVSKRVRWGEFK